MSKIKIMDTHLANMIAAGEVVERPSGIVKELIENSLDAKATSIEVFIEDGGMQSLSVLDNGEGMSAQDIVNALKRHSTSKVFSSADLNHISSFGFRGEALPSIASVSMMSIQTNNGVEGYEVIVDNGERKRLSVFARNKGTTVRIENLFSKVPARLKYIKNTKYETSIIVDLVQKFAIAHSHISFRLVENGKELFRTQGDKNLFNVFYKVFGTGPATNPIIINAKDYDFKIEGVFSQPEHTRANRYNIWLYINDRMIRHSKIHNAIIEGFRRHIPSDRFPIGVLKIYVDPQLVDVNVHPSKWEIRLSKEKELVNLIITSLEENLFKDTRAPRIKIKDEQQTLMESLLENPTVNYDEPTAPVRDFTQKEETKKEVIKEIEIEEATLSDDLVSKIEPLDVLAQMRGKYILAQGDEGLYIIDQHAAMERIRYEYYQDKLLNKPSDKQQLLFPVVFDGRTALVHREEDVVNAFKMFQVNIEILDEASFVIRERPLWIKENELNEFVNKTLDYLENNKTVREEDFRTNALATLACHSSVRFNDYLSKLEMDALVSQLRSCRQPFHCPHGRPTFMIIDEKTLIKGFLR